MRTSRLTRNASLASAGRTRTVPDGLRGGTSEGPKVVTALLLCDAGSEHELVPGGKRTTIGSAPDSDILIDSPFVSAHHCYLDRGLFGLRVTDTGSKNGTYVDGVRERGFYLRPGKRFVVGALPHRLLALNDEMRAHHPALRDILGMPDEHALPSETPSPSALILAAVQAGHLLITSEPHCEQDRLARIIHAISPRGSRRICELRQVPMEHTRQLELVRRRAARSTLVLDVGDSDVRLPSCFVRDVFSPRHQVRVIVLARSIDVAEEVLGEPFTRQLQRISLRPVASRPEIVEHLLDQMFKEKDSPLRTSQLTPANQRALRDYRWPENFASLRKAATLLTSIAAWASTNKAAQELDIPHSTLYHWYSKIIGLSRPLTSGELELDP